MQRQVLAVTTTKVLSLSPSSMKRETRCHGGGIGPGVDQLGVLTA